MLCRVSRMCVQSKRKDCFKKQSVGMGRAKLSSDTANTTSSPSLATRLCLARSLVFLVVFGAANVLFVKIHSLVFVLVHDLLALLALLSTGSCSLKCFFRWLLHWSGTLAAFGLGCVLCFEMIEEAASP